MPANPAAENVFGTLGTICWTVQLIPQIWKSWRTKSTEGLSPWLVLIWSLSAIPLGIYVIVQDLNVPLILQPQLFGLFALTSWAQCMYYGKGHSLRWCAASMLAILTIFAALEVGLVYAVRPSYRRGDKSGKRATQFFGVLSSVMITLALFPQYYDIYQRRAVVGISVLFMLVDMLGGVFSDLSLVFKPPFDIIASLSYTLVVILDGIILLAAVILNPRARRRQAQAAETPGPAASSTSSDNSTVLPMSEPCGTGVCFEGEKMDYTEHASLHGSSQGSTLNV
ncbi:PQ-loop-domain-containing protein [Artomyces pyxidatus]|uniref:PQ-loop-domain-containing protein n=1 Tax=Artomyces pyxidatus TaxID=48021 RepID=A0ACB8SWG1_9AGAM|nr:PQ-loop-domain-containing protein [Artomyces pyxidatus]